MKPCFVALESLGLGTCYIGAIRNDPAFVARELGLPPEVFPVFGLTVGYPDSSDVIDVKPRLPQAAVLHFEQYGGDEKGSDFSSYNDVLRGFQKAQDMPEIDWTEQMSRRIATKEALKNRDELKEVVKTLGFKLR